MSKKMSRREMLKVTAAGAAGLVATGIPGLVSKAASPPMQEAITLRFFERENRWRPIADAFAEMFPGTSVEFIDVSGVDDAEVASKILATMAAGQPLDGGKGSTEVTALYAAEGIAEPLTDRVMNDQDELAEYFDDVSPILTEAMMWEGDLYELPNGCNCPNMFFNLNLLEQAGLEMPDADWTKDDFLEYARALTNVGGEETFGYGWTNRMWGGWGMWYFVNGGNILREERAPGGEWLWDTFYADNPVAEGRGGGFRWPEPQANAPEVVEALEFVVSLTEEGLTPAVEIGGGDSLEGFFISDKIAMLPAGGFWAGGLFNAGMEKGTFDAQFWPKWKTQKHQIGVSGNWIFTGSPNKDRMWELLKFSVTVEGMYMGGRYRPVMTTTPARRSFVIPEAYEPTGPDNWQVFYDTLDHMDVSPIPSPPQAVEVTNIYTRFTSLATSGDMTAQDALDGMQAELEALYERTT